MVPRTKGTYRWDLNPKYRTVIAGRQVKMPVNSTVFGHRDASIITSNFLKCVQNVGKRFSVLTDNTDR